MILEESIWKEDLTILLQKIIGLIFLQSMLLISQLHSQLQSFKGSSFRSSIWALEEVGCWFLQRKLGRNRGKSSWGRITFSFLHLPFLQLQLDLARCTPCTFQRSLFRAPKEGERRAAVHAVHLQLCSFRDSKREERRAVVHAVQLHFSSIPRRSRG